MKIYVATMIDSNAKTASACSHVSNEDAVDKVKEVFAKQCGIIGDQIARIVVVAIYVDAPTTIQEGSDIVIEPLRHLIFVK